MDAIASTAFGLQIDSHNDPNNQFVRMANKIFEINLASFKTLIICKSKDMVKFKPLLVTTSLRLEAQVEGFVGMSRILFFLFVYHQHCHIGIIISCITSLCHSIASSKVLKVCSRAHSLTSNLTCKTPPPP